MIFVVMTEREPSLTDTRKGRHIWQQEHRGRGVTKHGVTGDSQISVEFFFHECDGACLFYNINDASV